MLLPCSCEVAPCNPCDLLYFIFVEIYSSSIFVQIYCWWISVARQSCSQLSIGFIEFCTAFARSRCRSPNNRDTCDAPSSVWWSLVIFKKQYSEFHWGGGWGGVMLCVLPLCAGAQPFVPILGVWLLYQNDYVLQRYIQSFYPGRSFSFAAPYWFIPFTMRFYGIKT